MAAYLSHSFALLTREISSSTLEEKFHIYAHPCIMLYIVHYVRTHFEWTLCIKWTLVKVPSVSIQLSL